MKKHPKESCPECGKQVSTYPPAWAQHMNAHKTEKIEASDLVAPEKPETKQEAPAPAIRIEKVNDPILQERIDRAMEVQKRFREAPELWASENSHDELMEHRRTYLPESIGEYDPKTGSCIKPPTKHEYFGDHREVDADINKGYIPVVHNGKHVVTPGGNPMYWIPQEMHLAKEQMYKRESDALLEQQAADMVDGETKARINTDGVIEEEFKVTRERINDG